MQIILFNFGNLEVIIKYSRQFSENFIVELATRDEFISIDWLFGVALMTSRLELNKRVWIKDPGDQWFRTIRSIPFVPQFSIQRWRVWAILCLHLWFTNSTGGPTMAGLRCTNEPLSFNEARLYVCPLLPPRFPSPMWSSLFPYSWNSDRDNVLGERAFLYCEIVAASTRNCLSNQLDSNLCEMIFVIRFCGRRYLRSSYF